MNTRILVVKLYATTREYLEGSGIKLPRFGDLTFEGREAWVGLVQEILADPKLIQPEP